TDKTPIIAKTPSISTIERPDSFFFILSSFLLSSFAPFPERFKVCFGGFPPLVSWKTIICSRL
ncbi:MAG: hypothetical protein IKJ28_05270, partial [Alphaproteobacteria bacterium]|nr:hypothetical protein [Alphaproteobacteria bacterium]